jgi:uncharacterized protein
MSPYLVEGVRLYAQGDYFLSHETLEEHWVEAPEEDRNFLQGLIHLAIGFHHHERGNPKGARLQFNKAYKRLEGYPDTYQGVDVGGVRSFLDGVEGSMDAGDALKPPELLRTA